MAVTLTVEGMSCEGCEQTVEDALKTVDGVENAQADRTSNSATIEGDADTDALVNAVNDAGYTASTQTIRSDLLWPFPGEFSLIVGFSSNWPVPRSINGESGKYPHP